MAVPPEPFEAHLAGGTSPRSNGLFLLCLDGGGVRGLSSLYILKALMASINVQNPPKPCQYFDMIGGTSTGGLIAIMLGRLGMTVDECIAVYRDLSSKVFTKVHHRLNIRGQVQGRFNHHAIEQCVKDLLRQKGLSEDTLLYDGDIYTCKTFVCATSKQTSNTVILSSYLNPRRGRDLADIATIWQAARATSAATSFFDDIEIGDEEFVDGATPANNPIMELWSEASDMFLNKRDGGRTLEGDLSCLVSVGTGIPTLMPFGDDPLNITKALVKIATDTEKRAQDFVKHHQKLYENKQYFRFNVSRGLETVGLEEESKRKEIVSATRDYIQTQEVFTLLQACSNKLIRPPDIYSDAVRSKEMTSRIADRIGDVRVSPMSTELAWFTNTKIYRSWAQSEGGCVLYRMQRPNAFYNAKNLARLLPMAWRSYPPSSTSADVYVAYFDASLQKDCSCTDFLLSICYQLLVSTHQDVSAWQTTMSEAKPKEWRLIAGISAAGRSVRSGPLFDLINFLLQNAKQNPHHNQTTYFLCVLTNLHWNSHPKFVHELLKIKDSFARIGVHLLISGSYWRSSNILVIDEDTEYLECLETLKFDDMYTRRNQVEHPQAGTNGWILRHPAFNAWNNRPAGILWIQGKPGSGKSVLAKSIIMNKPRDGSFLLASWFYSRRGGSVGMSHKSMMKSIAYQLLKQSRPLFNIFATIYRQSDFDERAFSKLLQLTVSDTICVLDGLDESVCRDTEGKLILQLLANATKNASSRLKFIILSRPYRTIGQVYGAYDILMEAENREDIKAVVEHRLPSLISTIDRDERGIRSFSDRGRSFNQNTRPCPEFTQAFFMENRVNKDLELASIKQYLLDNAQGVMLWVTLCIDYAVRRADRGLCSWTEIRKVIEGLPKELDDIYRTILSELPAYTDAEDLVKARKVLSWIIVAGGHRPLRLKELMDIISISDEWHLTDAARSTVCPLQDQRPVFVSWRGFAYDLGCLCGPFIEFINVSRGSPNRIGHGLEITACSVVQLLHQTVKDFLEESSDHIFRFMPGETQRIVEQDSYSYLCRVLPLQSMPYTPVLDDVDDNWKESVKDTVQYLEDKFLVSFILSANIISLQRYVDAACSPDHGEWPLRKFFLEVKYWDTDIIETTKESVVGRCFWLSCTLGMDTAVENLLHLSSLRPGWWVYHREAVLNGAGVAATDHNLVRLHASVSVGRVRDTLYVEPALKRNSLQDSSYRILRHQERQRLSTGGMVSSRRKSFHPDMPSRQFKSSPPPKKGADKRVVGLAICRILHYLEGHIQPLDTAIVKALGHLSQCRCSEMLQDQGIDL